MGDIYGKHGFYYGSSPSSHSYSDNMRYKRINKPGLGFPGSPATANQLGETINAIKQGVTAFEVQTLDADKSETIPKQHFKEMRQLMKISGVKPSLHAPIIDPSGFTKESRWTKNEMLDNQRRMFDSIERAYELNPKGNTPVVFHSTGSVPGAEWRKDKDGNVALSKAAFINKDTGDILQATSRKHYSPDDPDSLKKGGTIFTIENQLKSANLGEWDSKISELATLSKHADEVLGDNTPAILMHLDEQRRNGIDVDLNSDLLARQAIDRSSKAHVFINNISDRFRNTFDKAYEFGNDKQREELEKLASSYKRKIENLNYQSLAYPFEQNKILSDSIAELDNIVRTQPPQVYENVEKFAINKAAETFGNLAVRSWEKYKDNAPIIAIENLYQGMAFSRGEQMEELVKKARDNFKEEMVKSKKMTAREAQKYAEKHIGITLDVGHLNMFKKTGLDDGNLIEEVKKMGPYIKHLHLTDNFGYADTHLPPGMGNVPFKEIFEQLEKEGRLDEINKIVEAGAFVQEFKKSPHPAMLASLGSPIYGARAQTYWKDLQNTYGNYFGGYGTINPSVHHSIYGSGFSTLPIELGGKIPEGSSRFSGNKLA